MDIDQEELDNLQEKLLDEVAEEESDKMRVENTSIYTLRQEILKKAEQARKRDEQ